jgi:hypothetical protein
MQATTLSPTDAAILERVKHRFARSIRTQCPATRAIAYHVIQRLSFEQGSHDYALLQIAARTASYGTLSLRDRHVGLARVGIAP